MLLLVALAGCTNTTAPVLVDEVCTAWRDDGYYYPAAIPVSCGNNCTSTVTVIQYMPIWTCTAAVVVESPNPNFARTPERR